MADAPISGLTEFVPQARMLIPVVDPAAAPGLKNGYVTVAGLFGGDVSNATTMGDGATPVTIEVLAQQVAALETQVAALLAGGGGGGVTLPSFGTLDFSMAANSGLIMAV